MNKGCVCIDDKAIIIDESGNHTQTENYDNLEQILVQENLIEEMEKEIEVLNKESKKYPIPKEKYKPFMLYGTIIMLLVGLPLFLWGITGQNPYLLEMEIGLKSYNLVAFTTAMAGAIGLPIISLLSLFEYMDYRSDKKIAKGINSELEYLNKQLEKEKGKLCSLKNEGKVIKNDEKVGVRSFKVNDRQQLESLSEKLKLFYDLGSKDKKLYGFYQKGKLGYKLNDEYGESCVKLAEDYFKEKGPVLSRKRNKRGNI